jgi:hypothetical protein
MTVQLNLSGWSGWQGSSDTTNGDAAQDLDVAQVPPMLRRRLNSLGRIAVSQLLNQWQKGEDTPIVYTSRHGDIHRTLRVLQGIVAQEPMSPMQFSLAVHNAIVGVFSIQEKVHAPIQTLAAGAEPIIPTLLEMAALLEEGFERVYGVICDVQLPQVYQQFEAPEAPYCVVLVADQNGAVPIRIAQALDGCDAELITHPHQFVHNLEQGVGAMCCMHNAVSWTIQSA